MTNLVAAQALAEVLAANANPPAAAAQLIAETVAANPAPPLHAAQLVGEAIAANGNPPLHAAQLLVEVIGWVGTLPGPVPPPTPSAGGDIALVWDPANGRADFAIARSARPSDDAGTDLLMDAGLHTSVIISLFCDRLADPADTIPDGTDDRRGWWGDTPLPNSTDPITPDLTGSRLWLLARALQVNETLRRAEKYAQEALQWMIDDGVAGSVTASAAFPAAPPQTLELTITINQPGGSQSFAFAWSAS